MIIGALMGGCGTENKPSNDALSISGEALYNRCKACHTLGKGERNIIGPNLWNIMGSNIAGKTDFLYSKALSSQDGIWDEANLDSFLRSPQGFAPGTKMSFSGVKDTNQRAALIDYLSKQTDVNP